MNWREVYQLPFRTDEYGIYMCSNNGTTTLTFTFSGLYDERQKMVENIVNKLNGDSSIKFDSKFTLRNNIYFSYGSKSVFYIRGWGKLTGIGGYRLPADEAANIQEEFAKWVLETLNS